MKRRALLRFVALVGLVVCTTTAWAETVYVNDMLRVGVRERPNSSQAPITIVTTGMALEVLEHRDGYIRVRTKDGTEGWINDVYATDEVPARRRLKEVVADQERLKKELAQQRSAATTAEQESSQLQAHLGELAKRNEVLQAQLNKARRSLSARANGDRWLYLGGVIIVLFVFGFFLGTRWYRQRVTERFGGLQV